MKTLKQTHENKCVESYMVPISSFFFNKIKLSDYIRLDTFRSGKQIKQTS